MHDILDLPEVRQRVSRLSVAEYHQLGEFNENGKRTELIRGIIIEKMPKSPLHASIMTILMKAMLPSTPGGYLLRVDNPLTLADSEPEPDFAVVRGSISDFFSTHPSTADLVIEVAVTSETLDREKAALYAEAGVKEYWIVLAERQEVEVYRQPEGSRYLDVRTRTRDEILDCSGVPQLRIELARIFPN